MITKSFRSAFILASLIVVGASTQVLASSRVGFSLNISVPPRIVVESPRYEPYYVGRIFDGPAHAWRAVYSFPIETAGGVVWEPYIYDHGRLVCSHRIPSAYGQLIVEGHGHFDPRWHGGYHNDRVVYRHDNGRHRGWDRDHERSDRGHERHHGDRH